MSTSWTLTHKFDPIAYQNGRFKRKHQKVIVYTFTSRIRTVKLYRNIWKLTIYMDLIKYNLTIILGRDCKYRHLSMINIKDAISCSFEVKPCGDFKSRLCNHLSLTETLCQCQCGVQTELSYRSNDYTVEISCRVLEYIISINPQALRFLLCSSHARSIHLAIYALDLLTRYP